MKLLRVTLSFMAIMVASQLYSQSFENTLTYDSLKGSPKASIHDFSWIAGHWKGEAMGGIIEEIWTPPLAGAMMGVFKLVDGNTVVFYEIETLTEEEGSVILRLKHFGAKLKGWEEKDDTIDFKLVKLAKNKAYFDGLTFELVNENELAIYVVIEENNTSEEMGFHYTRVKN
ncbi:MAG: DUF6265 family protein [Cyclobacteriaceae bacterium]|nr:DUF6265 family protein [Cyclobacteriaceae bacterium]